MWLGPQCRLYYIWSEDCCVAPEVVSSGSTPGPSSVVGPLGAMLLETVALGRVGPGGGARLRALQRPQWIGSKWDSVTPFWRSVLRVELAGEHLVAGHSPKNNMEPLPCGLTTCRDSHWGQLQCMPGGRQRREPRRARLVLRTWNITSWGVSSIWSGCLLGTSPLEVFWARPTGRRPRSRLRTLWRYCISHLAWQRLRIPQEKLKSVGKESCL